MPFPADGVTAVLWDAEARDADEIRQLQQGVRRFAPIPLLVLLDFVRREDEAWTSAAAPPRCWPSRSRSLIC